MDKHGHRGASLLKKKRIRTFILNKLNLCMCAAGWIKTYLVGSIAWKTFYSACSLQVNAKISRLCMCCMSKNSCPFLWMSILLWKLDKTSWTYSIHSEHVADVWRKQTFKESSLTIGADIKSCFEEITLFTPHTRASCSSQQPYEIRTMNWRTKAFFRMMEGGRLAIRILLDLDP